MKGLGLFLILVIVYSVSFTSLGDNCHSVQSCPGTSISCGNELPSNSSSDDRGIDHCLFHCGHNVSLVLVFSEIHFQLPLQEPAFTLTQLNSSAYLTRLFRPPIA